MPDFSQLVPALLAAAPTVLVVLIGAILVNVLIGRVLPISRGLRIAIVALFALLFLIGVVWYAGVELVGQFEALKAVVTTQLQRIQGWASQLGLMPRGGPAEDIGRQLMGSLGQLTSAVGTALGAVSSLAMIVVLGLFIAAEPRIYERGLAWMLPIDQRHSSNKPGAKSTIRPVTTTSVLHRSSV